MRKTLLLLLILGSCTRRDDAKDREIAALRAQLGAQGQKPEAPSLGAVRADTSAKLAPEMARKILIEKLWTADERGFGPKKACWWQEVNRTTDREYVFNASDKVDARCVKALHDAGLVDAGPCVESSGGTCWKAAITAKGGAWFDQDYLAFMCATVSLPEIRSVTTEGSKATVVYERTATLDEGLINKLTACKLEKPDDLGKLEKTKTFTRDDAGNWRLDMK